MIGQLIKLALENPNLNEFEKYIINEFGVSAKVVYSFVSDLSLNPESKAILGRKLLTTQLQIHHSNVQQTIIILLNILPIHWKTILVLVYYFSICAMLIRVAAYTLDQIQNL